MPGNFKILEANGVHIRRGQLTLVAAAPGGGKSLFTLSTVMNAKVPGFYFSADTDAFTMYLRAASKETGWLMTDIETVVKAGRTELIDAKLNANDTVRFSFDPSPTLDDIDEELMAFAMTYGEWPHLIVVDNLRNVDVQGDADGDALCDYLHALARKTGAAVIALHHVTGQYNNGNIPIPLGGIMGQIGKVPELILTLYRQGGDFGPMTMRVCPVKNRTGRADPTAELSYPLIYEPERMRLEG